MHSGILTIKNDITIRKQKKLMENKSWN